MKSGGRKRARKSRELVKKKISRESRVQWDPRGTKLAEPFTSEPLSLREAKRRRSESEKKKTEKSKMLQALKKKTPTRKPNKRKAESKPTHHLLKGRVLLQNKT